MAMLMKVFWGVVACFALLQLIPNGPMHLASGTGYPESFLIAAGQRMKVYPENGWKKDYSKPAYRLNRNTKENRDATILNHLRIYANNNLRIRNRFTQEHQYVQLVKNSKRQTFYAATILFKALNGVELKICCGTLYQPRWWWWKIYKLFRFYSYCEWTVCYEPILEGDGACAVPMAYFSGDVKQLSGCLHD